MCRYGLYGPYKDHFACFDCRKAFKQTNPCELPKHLQLKEEYERVCLCPQCRTPMSNMGMDFKAPKKSDVKQWEKVRILFKHGFSYHSCGCCGPGLRPNELKEVEEFIAGHRTISEGELLLEKIRDRSWKD